MAEFYERTFENIRDLGSSIYTGIDRLAGGVLPGGQDFNQGYIADIGRTLGLPVSSGVPGGVASTIDTQSIQPNLDLNYEQPSQEGAFQDFFSAPADGTMGLSDVFGDGGGGFIPPGYNSEAEMVAAGIGDGWTPTTYYEFTHSDATGSGAIGVTDLENGRYKIDMVNPTTGKAETFIQTGLDGKGGITDYESNASTPGEMAGSTELPRVNGVDLSSLFATAAVDPSSKLEMGTVMGGTPVDMQRIDNLDSATFISLTPSSPIRGGGGVTKESEQFSNDVLKYMNQLEQAGVGTVIESNPFIQQVKDGKSVEEVFGTTFTNTDPVINDIAGDLNTTLPSLDNNSSLADAFASGGLADGNQAGLYSTPTQRYLEDENVLDTKADEFMGALEDLSDLTKSGEIPAGTYSPVQEIFEKPADEAIADMVAFGISKETATKIINKRDASTGNKQPMQFTNSGTVTNNINPGDPITQENSNEDIADEYSVNAATGIITQTNPDGSETEIVSNENQLNPRSDEIGPSIEDFHDYMETQAFYEEMKRRPNEGGDSSSLVLYDIVSEPMLDDLRDKYVEAGKEAGLKQDQIDKLKGAGTWDDLKQTANDAFDLNAPGTLKGLSKVLKKSYNLLTGKSLKKIDEARKTHNINMQEQKAIRPVLEEKLKEQRSLGQDIESLEDLNLSGYALQMSIQDALNSTDDFDTKIDLAEALTELKGAEMLGMDIALIDDDDFSLSLTRTDDERYNNTYENDGLGDTSSPSSYLSGKLADSENPFNPSDEPFKQPTLAEGGNQEGWDISNDTTREPQSWGVMNEDGKAVAKWNPFAKESAQEEVAQDVVNPNRSVSDGYSSPTMATIDRNIRPTLDRVGDLVEYPFEAVGMGMYNTIGQLPLVGGIGKSVGNTLARTGQGLDRAIDTKLPDSLFGLKTGDDGTGGDGENEIPPEMLEVMKSGIYDPGNSPLVEILRDKHFGRGYYANGGGGSGQPGYYMNSVSDPSMSIYGGSGSGIASSGGVPGGVGGMGQSGGEFDGMSSMADGFDLSTPEGQAKYANLYGEDRLADELSKRGLFDRRAAEAEAGTAEQEEVYAGIANENYRLKEHFEKPQQNIGEEIAKGINQVQDKGVFA